VSNDEPKMLFYDGEGHRTSEGKAVVQYLSDDPNRPDAGKGGASEAHTSSAGTNALAERQALVAQAKELGIPAKGKSDELKAAIAAAEAKAMTAPPSNKAITGPSETK
jgi:imidazolonepropionase-like amidohydrolase